MSAAGANVAYWVCISLIVIGLLLTILLGALWISARNRPPAPGMPPGTERRGGAGLLVGAILSLVLLVLTPAMVMLIAGVINANRAQSGGNGGLPPDVVNQLGGLGGLGSGNGDRPADIRNGTWRATFDVTSEGITYRAEFRPVNGEGPMVVVYTPTGRGEQRVRQTCRMSGTDGVRITCRDVALISGDAGYLPDTFQVNVDGDRMSGTMIGPNGARTGSAQFVRGPLASVRPGDWSASGRTSGGDTAPPAPPSGEDSALASQLEIAASALRRTLPQRNGPATITNVSTSGTRLNLDVEVSQDFGEAQWSQLDTVLQQQTCAGAYAQQIARGASVVYRIRDSGGERRETLVNRC